MLGLKVKIESVPWIHNLFSSEVATALCACMLSFFCLPELGTDSSSLSCAQGVNAVVGLHKTLCVSVCTRAGREMSRALAEGETNFTLSDTCLGGLYQARLELTCWVRRTYHTYWRRPHSIPYGRPGQYRTLNIYLRAKYLDCVES